MFEHFGIKDLIDILLVAALLYYLFKMVKISGMRPLFLGVVIFMIIWVLVSQVFDMVVLGSILDQFVNIGLILLVILFKMKYAGFLCRSALKGWKFVAKLFVPGDKQQKIQHISHLLYWPV